MIEEGLIKGKPTAWCKPGCGKKDPCFGCTSDAMCTEMDSETQKTNYTFMEGYKKEHRVIRCRFYLVLFLVYIGWGDASSP